MSRFLYWLSGGEAMVAILSACDRFPAWQSGLHLGVCVLLIFTGVALESEPDESLKSQFKKLINQQL